MLAVGLDTPGPASANGVISARGSTNFSAVEWWGFDFRSAVEQRLRLPVIYLNDGNAAALYAHERHFGDDAWKCSSVSAIVGTGLGGGVVEAGRVIRGAAGMAGELGHVQIPMDGLLVPGQPVPRCNCGLAADLESVASLSGIVNNLLPFWLTRYPGHPLADVDLGTAAKQVRDYGERGDELAVRIFDQQAMAIGRMFTIAANVLDPEAYFVGGGVTDTGVEFRTGFVERVRAATELRDEQADVATFAIVPDLDMAGARGRPWPPSVRSDRRAGDPVPPEAQTPTGSRRAGSSAGAASSPPSVMAMRRCRRRSGAGAHQLASPASFITAGTSRPRMTKASIRMASASVRPNILIIVTPDVPNAMNVTDINSAAAVTMRPVRSSPRATAVSLSPVRSCSSLMRESRKTS